MGVRFALVETRMSGGRALGVSTRPHFAGMDDTRLGLAARAIRQRRGWRQLDLAQRALVSQGLISLLERGQLVHVSMAALRRVFGALDAQLEIRVQWRGGEIDRLLDRRHAGIVEGVVQTLRGEGWETRPEVTFSRFGERGSIDVLSSNAALGAVLLAR